MLHKRLASFLAQIKRGEHISMVSLAVLIGVLAGYGAIGFRLLIDLAHRLFFFTASYSVEVAAALPWWRLLLQPAVGGLLVGLIVVWFCPEVRGSGVPEVMESVAKWAGNWPITSFPPSPLPPGPTPWWAWGGWSRAPPTRPSRRS